MSGERSHNRRVAVVTGGAGAIGGAIATRLAADHTVTVHERTGDVVVDLGDTDNVRRAAELVLILERRTPSTQDSAAARTRCPSRVTTNLC
jgi:NAD(P)-dependent dehydrogenase (short-subunit alcohol dehydrogenase family)